MEIIKNTTVLIGKDPINGRLLVSVTANGNTKTATIGEVGSVNNSVSRCYPEKNIAHCKIVVDSKGEMTIFNMKPRNVTYVNDVEILSKKLKPGCSIKLGKSRFPIDLGQILKIVQTIIQGMSQIPQEYSTSSLEEVWADYQRAQRNIQEHQRKIGLLRSVPMVFTLSGSLLIGLGGPEIKPYSITFTIIAAVIMIYGLYKGFSDNSFETRDRITKEFQRKYVCPNPECRHFLGNMSYEILTQDKYCKYCRCKWVHNSK